MFEKYLYALGRGVRGVRDALDEHARASTPDPAAAARDVTPPKTADAPSPGLPRGGHVPLARDQLELGKRVLLMGIVNVTPDSFSDGGRFIDPARATAQAMKLQGDGADILDIGGESTRPNAKPVPASEEAARVIPVIEALTGRITTPISIDTMKAPVAQAAIEAGASIINDVWGFQFDRDIARVAADARTPCILMHNRHEEDAAIDIFDDVRSFLSRSIDIALAAGVCREAIILDPGIGFGKTNEQSLEMVRRLDELKAAFRMPVLLGVSRKRMTGLATGHTIPADRDAATLAANIYGIGKGADILRVHNVAVHADALKMMNAIDKKPERP